MQTIMGYMQVLISLKLQKSGFVWLCRKAPEMYLYKVHNKAGQPLTVKSHTIQNDTIQIIE